jgi:hypothetical protein
MSILRDDGEEPEDAPVYPMQLSSTRLSNSVSERDSLMRSARLLRKSYPAFMVQAPFFVITA